MSDETTNPSVNGNVPSPTEVTANIDITPAPHDFVNKPASQSKKFIAFGLGLIIPAVISLLMLYCKQNIVNIIVVVGPQFITLLTYLLGQSFVDGKVYSAQISAEAQKVIEVIKNNSA